MRSSRLLSLLILLQLRTRLTAEALAQEFAVSVRTIYRDIEALGTAGVPVRAERGPGGGFALVEGYRTRLTGLAADEAQAMLMIGLPEPAAALGLGAAASRARGKLLAALPRSGSSEALRLGARFHLDPLDWYRTAEPVDQLPALTRAVLEQRAVTMRYDSWRGSRDWRVEPLGLVLKAGSWYLVARGGGKVRTFKVVAITTPLVLDEAFERPQDFDLPTYWSESLARFEQQLRRERACLLLTPEGCRRLAELGAYAQQALAAAQASAAGLRVELPVESVEQAARLVLGLAGEARVLEPPALRTRVRELALRIARAARPA